MKLQDYNNNSISLTYNYIEKDSTLQLIFANKEKWIIRSTLLNWKTLPAVQDNLHYTIDEIN